MRKIIILNTYEIGKKLLPLPFRPDWSSNKQILQAAAFSDDGKVFVAALDQSLEIFQFDVCSSIFSV
jgi:hypothetical protein